MTKIFLTIESKLKPINRNIAGPFYLLFPIIIHLPLFIGLEMAKENGKIAAQTLMFCSSNELSFLLQLRKVKQFSSFLQVLLILCIPLYYALTPTVSDRFKDFNQFIMFIAFGTTLAFAVIALFSFNTRRVIGPLISEIIKQNETRILSENLNSIKLKRENKLLKNILRQENIQIYFSVCFTVYNTIAALLGVPFEYILCPVAMIMFSSSSVFIITVPFLNICYARKNKTQSLFLTETSNKKKSHLTQCQK